MIVADGVLASLIPRLLLVVFRETLEKAVFP